MDTRTIVSDCCEQVDWYGKLLKLAQLQHALVEQDRTDDLLVVLDRRTRIVEQLSAIEGRLRPIKSEWHAIAGTIDTNSRATIESKFAAARELLAQITQSDQDDALVLQQRKLAVGRQLHRSTVGQKTNRGYAAINAYGNDVGGRMDVSQ